MKINLLVSESASDKELKAKFSEKLASLGINIKGNVKVDAEAYVYARVDAPDVRAYKYVTAAASIYRGDILVGVKGLKNYADVLIFAADNPSLTKINMFAHASTKSAMDRIFNRLSSIMPRSEVDAKAKEFLGELNSLLDGTEYKAIVAKNGVQPNSFYIMPKTGGKGSSVAIMTVYGSGSNLMVDLKFTKVRTDKGIIGKLFNPMTTKETLRTIKLAFPKGKESPPTKAPKQSFDRVMVGVKPIAAAAFDAAKELRSKRMPEAFHSRLALTIKELDGYHKASVVATSLADDDRGSVKAASQSIRYYREMSKRKSAQVKSLAIMLQAYAKAATGKPMPLTRAVYFIEDLLESKTASRVKKIQSQENALVNRYVKSFEED